MDQLSQELVRELKKLKVYNLTASQNEISVRCPFCGDSKKNSRSSHFYIKLNRKENEPFLYYCQKCQVKGILNSEILKKLQLNDLDLILDITDLNKNVKLDNKRNNTRKRVIKINNGKPNKFSLRKYDYFKNRLGINIEFDKLKDYKIVLNLYDLLDYNHIETLTNNNEKLCNYIDKNFICFLSYDNNYLVCRNLDKESKFRYYNYNITGNYDETKKFFVIPNKIDILNPELNVVIAEGIFDIFGIYFHVKNQYKENTLYIAANGTGYKGIIDFLLSEGFLKLNLEIYSDADQNIEKYKFIKNDYYMFLNDFHLYYNSIGKDYGVKKEEIRIIEKFI